MIEISGGIITEYMIRYAGYIVSSVGTEKYEYVSPI